MQEPGYRIFKAEHYAVWLVAIIGVSLSLAALWLINLQLEAHKRLDFEWVAHNRIRAIGHGIDNAISAVSTIHDFYQVSDHREQKEFQRFADLLLNRYPAIQELLWISRETASDSSDSTASEPDVVIKEKSEQLHLKGANTPFYFTNAAQKLNPGHMPALSPEMKTVLTHSLEQAWSGRRMVASGRVVLARNEGQPIYGVLLALPVFSQPLADDLPDRVEDILHGFAVGVFQLYELINSSIVLLEPRGVEILLLDDTAESHFRYLNFYSSRLSPREMDELHFQAWLNNDSESKVEEIIQVADRNWRIVCGRTESFLSAEAFKQTPWVALVAGLLFTVLLSFYLMRMEENEQTRALMQMQLVEREELFRQMTETVDEVFWAATPDGKKLLYLSPAYERIFGDPDITFDHAQALINAFPLDDRVRLLSAIRRIGQGAESADVVHRIMRKDGSTRWVRTRGFPVVNERSEIYRLVGFAEDITEKKLADEALIESEAKLRDMFQQSPDIIMTVDKRGKILLMNRSIPTLPAERAVGRSSLALMPYEFRKWFRRSLKKVFRKGVTRQFEYSARDGTYWEGRIVPINSNETPQAAMVIATDVTEKRKLELQAQRNARLASIGVLSAGVAHEINNPNNAIQFNSTLVSRAWRDIEPILAEYHAQQGDFALGGLSYAEARETFPQLLTEITKNSDRIRRIVENLKHMARQDTGKLEEQVDLQQVLESTMMILHNQIMKHTDVCTLKVPDNLPAIKGNSQQLEQVFINVLLNALQSLPSRERGVHMLAKTSSDQQHLEIVIQDEGTGISKHDLGRLTEPFFTTRTESGATGLGLSITRSIIERHGGTLKFDSKLGAGTTLTIKFPIIS